FADNSYMIRPRRKEDYEELLRELDASCGVPGVIVNLWGVTSHDVPTQACAYKENEELGFYSLLYLTQSVGKKGLTDLLRIIVVSNEAQEVTGEEAICPEKALVLGLCRVVPQEYLNITCRIVDVSLSRFGTPWEQALVRALVAEVTVADSDLNVAYRGKRRWVEIFEPLRIDGTFGPNGGAARNSLLREGGVYLITGGLGRVGLALAAHLARTVKAKLVLLGRTPAPPREEWDQLL